MFARLSQWPMMSVLLSCPENINNYILRNPFLFRVPYWQKKTKTRDFCCFLSLILAAFKLQFFSCYISLADIKGWFVSPHFPPVKRHEYDERKKPKWNSLHVIFFLLIPSSDEHQMRFKKNIKQKSKNITWRKSIWDCENISPWFQNWNFMKCASFWGFFLKEFEDRWSS